MLYLLDPEETKVSRLKNADPIVAWAISFPSSDSSRRVSNEKYVMGDKFMANSVLWGSLNEWVD